MESESNLG